MRYLLLTVLLLLPGDDPKTQGRRGNALYEKGQHEQAAAAYQQGLSALEAGRAADVRYGLMNNLGAALHRMQNLEGARTALLQALSLAESPADVARTAYNAGNNAFAREELEAALDFYKQALLADPSDENAKFNYEYVRRRLEEQQQQQQQQSGRNQDQQDQNQQQQQQNQEQQGQQQEEDQDQQGQEQQQQPQQGDQQQQQEEQRQEEQQGRQQQQPDPNQLSQEQAERILQALEKDEEQLLRQVQKLKTRPRRVEKDW